MTLTVISSSFLSPEAAAAAAAVKGTAAGKGTTEKRRGGKKSQTAALSPEQYKDWSGGLPSVTERIPYTDVLQLKEQGKLKHIIKLPSSSLKQHRSDAILVVLDDSRVLRTVLPDVQRDEQFWAKWDRLGMDAFYINAYTPPLKNPQMPTPYLEFLRKVPSFLFSLVKEKPRSKRVLELENARMALANRRKLELAMAKAEKESMEKAIRKQKRKEERKRKAELRSRRKAQHKQSLREAKIKSQMMGLQWMEMARNKTLTTLIGFVMFVVFYWVVVLNYRRQKKDYEDRLKLEEAEREEKKEGLETEAHQGGNEQNPAVQMAMQYSQSGRQKYSPKLDPDKAVKFSDVAGLGDIRFELEEIVKFFTQAEVYQRRGVKIPGGILLCGPPGVGKTLLAKAVAGEAGVNFLSVSASQFVEMYVGVGASRVRTLYKEAKDNAPTVIFIDELDAVGRARGTVRTSGGQERDSTLNQLLVCLDGFEGRGNVITIAATNRPDILDPALVRPGRFDRKIFIPRPSFIGRKEILQVHARKKPVAKDLDYDAVAAETEGLVGADLANLFEIAVLNIIRDGRNEITTDDLLHAAQKDEGGLFERRERSLDMWKRIALREAALAVAAVNFPDTRKIEFITISPRVNRGLGYVRAKMDQMNFAEVTVSRQSILDYITLHLAPRAADEILHGSDQLCTISCITTNQARFAARAFVTCGFSEKNFGLVDSWISDDLDDIDLEALQILNMCYDRAKKILGCNRALLDAVHERLILEKSVTKEEFFQFVEEHGHLEPLEANIIDIRADKKAEFEELIMKGREATTGHGA